MSGLSSLKWRLLASLCLFWASAEITHWGFEDFSAPPHLAATVTSADVLLGVPNANTRSYRQAVSPHHGHVQVATRVSGGTEFLGEEAARLNLVAHVVQQHLTQEHAAEQPLRDHERYNVSEVPRPEGDAPTRSPTRDVAISAVCVGLMLVAISMFVEWGHGLRQAAPGQSDEPLQDISRGPTSYECLLVFTWVVLGTAHIFAQHRASSVKFSQPLAVIAMYLLKVFFATTMFFAKEGGPSTFFWTLWQHKADALLLLCPAFCYAMYDLLSFFALAMVSPAIYQMILQTKTIFMIPVWQFAMNRSLSTFQLKSVVLMASGIAILELPRTLEMLGVDKRTEGSWDHCVGVAIVVAEIMMSILASVANEKLLKSRPLSTDFQNAVMYTQSSIILCLGTLWHAGSSEFAVEEWQVMFRSSEVMASIVSLALCGIATAYFLRYLNNIIKEICNGIVTALSTVATWFMYTESVKYDLLCQYQGLVIVLMACTLFAIAPSPTEQEATRKIPKAEQITRKAMV